MKNLNDFPDVREYLPSVDDIRDHLPSMNDVRNTLPSLDEVRSHLPSVKDIRKHIPSADEIRENLPSLKDVRSPGGLAVAGFSALVGLALGGYYVYRSRFNGNGHAALSARPYEEWTKQELYDRARELDIEGRSNMSKEELIEALRA